MQPEMENMHWNLINGDCLGMERDKDCSKVSAERAGWWQVGKC